VFGCFCHDPTFGRSLDILNGRASIH
jgi:hypothetical protein